jgi:hypothetical protein
MHLIVFNVAVSSWQGAATPRPWPICGCLGGGSESEHNSEHAPLALNAFYAALPSS